MTKLGGWSRPIKGRPHQRAVCIPLAPGQTDSGYVVPEGCRILSHTTFMRHGYNIMQIIVDCSNQTLGNEPPMPDGWDYRHLLRDGVTPVRRRVARRKAQREPGGRD